MERLTSKRANGIKTGYWSTHNKDELIQRLGPYEDIGYSPEAIREAMRTEKDGGWIDPLEELPPDPEDDEDAEVVLAIVSGKSGSIILSDAYEFAQYEPGEGWYLLNYPASTCVQVRWWRPLPDPPRRHAR